MIRLDPSVRRLDDDRVLLGGSPMRLLKLSATARAVLATDDWESRAGRALTSRLIAAGLAHPQPQGGPDLGQVSVVIPVRDRAEAVRRLVEGLDPALEIIVVDDGSVPALPPLGQVTVRHEDARGPGAARNTGIARATRAFVALLDSDVVAPQGWLTHLLPHFSDPRVAAVAPRIVTARGGALSWTGRTLAHYDAVRSPLDLGDQPAAVTPGSRVSYLPAAALVLRRAALGDRPELSGPFDEELRYGEDVDLIWRLVSAGWTVRYEPQTAVGHAHRATLRATAVQRFGYGYSAAPLAARHPGKLAPFAGNRWTIAAWGLLATGHPRSAATTLAVATGKLSRKLPVRRAVPLATQLVAQGTLASGRAIGDALARPYGPIALQLLLAAGRRARLVAAAALVLPAAAEYARSRPQLGPLSWITLRTGDNLAYGLGLWAGCARERSLAALRPRLS
jgi:mycofactocin system glycosyltransferase